MSLGDIFRRKSLLPAGKLAKLNSNAPPSKDSSKIRTPPQRSSAEAAAAAISPSGQEVFERPTVVPNLPADEHARSLMQQLDEREPVSSKPRSRANEVPLSSAALDLDLGEGSALGFLERQHQAPGNRAHRPPPTRAPNPAAQATATSPRVTDTTELSSAELDTVPPRTPEDDRTSPGNTPQVPQQRSISAADLYAVGDFSGALALAEQRLQEVPDDEQAQNYRLRCQEVLTKMWTARLGSLDRALRVLIPPDQIRWLSVDHRAGFVLSLLDGHSTIDEVLDICGMPRLQALRILAELLNRGVIEVVR